MVDSPYNPILSVDLARPINTTLGYMEWRDTVAHHGEDLFNALKKMTAQELRAAHDRLLGGLTAERLNPSASHGNFHLAAGMIRGLLYKLGHKLSIDYHDALLRATQEELTRRQGGKR